MTMVRNDIFLRRWVDYYGRQLGRNNLYIFFDGEDQYVPTFCDGCHTRVIPKIRGTVVDNDYFRSRFLSERAAELFAEGADMVIATDADEFLVVDPDFGMGLREFFSRCKAHPCISGLGVDVMQKVPEETAIDFEDFSRTFLSQRHYGRLYARYSKPSVITRPLTWGGGFHRVKGKNFHIADGLYLFHFGAADIERLGRISSDPARVAGGWGRHQNKRMHAIEAFNRIRILPWLPTTRRVRLLQTICRPIFAPNKPSTLGLRFIVKIPDKFNETI